MGTGAFGLETERMCEIVVTGDMGNVETAKVQVLVMLDELVRPDGVSRFDLAPPLTFSPHAERSSLGGL